MRIRRQIRSRLLAGALVCATLTASHDAHAQAEAGIARDARTRQVLECLHVSLVDTAGNALAHTVTDSAGRFMLEAPRPGAYRVRFEAYAWDPLAGPVDTLKDGDFRQRIYPVAFTNMLLPDSTRDTLRLSPSALASRAQVMEDYRRRVKNYDAIRAFHRKAEEGITWKSRHLDSIGIRVHYPQRMWEIGAGGLVIGQLIIDSTGLARRGSWRVIQSTHPDFDKVIRDAIPNLHWQPARNDGRPVCQLTQELVRFDLDGRAPAADMLHIWWMTD